MRLLNQKGKPVKHLSPAKHRRLKKIIRDVTLHPEESEKSCIIVQILYFDGKDRLIANVFQQKGKNIDFLEFLEYV